MTLSPNIFTYRLIFHVVTFMFLCNSVKGQDLHFSQFYEAPLLRNPALAGLYEGDVRIQGVYRNQWNSVAFPYQTGSINAENKFPVGRGEDFLTVGGQVLYDKAGSVQLQTIHMLPMVNFHKSLSTYKVSYLSLGFMSGVVNRRLDRSRVTTNSQYDGFYFNGALPDGETFTGGYSYADMSVGMSFNTTLGSNNQHYVFGGLAYHHFNKPMNSFFGSIVHLPKWVASGGLKLNLDELSYITFHGDITDQKPFSEIVAGGIYSKRIGNDYASTTTINAGLYYRYKDAIVPVMKFEVNQLSIGISYDINISGLAPASLNRGGFELSLGYLAIKPKHAELILCPKF